MVTPGRKLMLLVERMSGVVLPDRELERLTEWARSRASLRGFRDLNSYVDALRRNQESDEWRVLLSRVTVKESSLFRAPQQFKCLSESIIPEMIASGRTELRVWSAGCARGEEPATLAVVLDESLGGTNVQWSIVGTDVDADALEAARRARFSPRSVRRVPAEYLERYFRNRSGDFELKADTRSHIRYASLNLIREPLEVPDQPFDIIFLRNVLIYFRRESQARVVRSVQEVLSPGGFLLVGPSESLMHVAPGMKAEERNGVFVYRRRDGGEAPTAVRRAVYEESHTVPNAASCEPIGSVSERGTNDSNAFAVEGHKAEIQNDLRSALRCYRASLYLQPDCYQVRYRLGLCLQSVGWTGRADAEFRTIVEVLRSGSGKALEIFSGPDFLTRKEIEAECKEAVRKAGAG